jgi:hypothetical protein
LLRLLLPALVAPSIPQHDNIAPAAVAAMSHCQMPQDADVNVGINCICLALLTLGRAQLEHLFSRCPDAPCHCCCGCCCHCLRVVVIVVVAIVVVAAIMTIAKLMLPVEPLRNHFLLR